jgi:HlyD family type I secretion membrane fusion protein
MTRTRTLPGLGILVTLGALLALAGAGDAWWPWPAEIVPVLFAVAVVALVSNAFGRRRSHLPPLLLTNAVFPSAPSRPPVGGWIQLGMIIALVAFGGFGTWAALAPIASASLAPGTVRVDTNRKTVQHLEGGIIREIFVRDGDYVREGQTLIRLDDVDARAELVALQGQIDALQAREARLRAQRDQHETIDFGPDSPTGLISADRASIFEGQTRIFTDQARALEAEIAVLRQRAEQFRAQIGAYEAENQVLALHFESLSEELSSVRRLLDLGLERRHRVLELEREANRTEGQVAVNNSHIRALGENIIETQLQINLLRDRGAREISEELREVQTLLAELLQRSLRSEAQAGRRDIFAPQDGHVVNMRYFTIGGVITPGAEIMDIVPDEDELVIEARIRPLDIDVVRQGLPAIVRLVAYRQRTTPALDGIVTRVSADALMDPRTGEPYFLATVAVTPEELARVPSAALYPGMPVDVSIVTGERSLLAYLAQPFSDSLAAAFRED